MTSTEILLAILAFAAAGVSALLCWKQREGWGWFLFVAVLAISELIH